MENPKKKHGSQMCLRFHILSYCLDDCNYKSGHDNLDSDKTEDLKTFTGKANDNRGQCQTHHRGENDNRVITPNNNPTDNATNAVGEYPTVP